MSCNKVLGPRGEVIVVYGTGVRYTWLTPWMLAHGMTAADALLNLQNVTGNWETIPASQTAAVLQTHPDAPAVFPSASYTSTEGYNHFRESTTLTGKYWVRFGVASKNSSGASLGSAEVEMQTAVAQCGDNVGTGTVSVNPGMISGTDINYFPITGFDATIGLDKVMAAFAVMDNESDYLEYQLVCRTANDPRAPNAWQTMEASWTNPSSSNTLRNTGALSAPAGANASSNFLIQFGVAVRKKSGAGGNPRAELHVAIARSNA